MTGYRLSPPRFAQIGHQRWMIPFSQKCGIRGDSTRLQGDRVVCQRLRISAMEQCRRTAAVSSCRHRIVYTLQELQEKVKFLAWACLGGSVSTLLTWDPRLESQHRQSGQCGWPVGNEPQSLHSSLPYRQISTSPPSTTYQSPCKTHWIRREPKWIDQT